MEENASTVTRKKKVKNTRSIFLLNVVNVKFFKDYSEQNSTAHLKYNTLWWSSFHTMNSRMVWYPQTNQCSTEKNSMEDINPGISVDTESPFAEFNISLW